MVAVSLKKFFFQAEDGIRDMSVRDWSSDVCSSDLNTEGKQELRNGTYKLYIGGQQPDNRSEQLTGKKVVSLELNI